MSWRVRRALAIAGSAVFGVVAPGFVDGLVPRWISRRRHGRHPSPTGRGWTGNPRSVL